MEERRRGREGVGEGDREGKEMTNVGAECVRSERK